MGSILHLQQLKIVQFNCFFYMATVAEADKYCGI